ncbi:MAG TPA: deoxyribose-phosphate aldolase, partial [Capsulimonadaceae bacterium]|nr:deoxyribose-phosphate aldolase [Capsulimonadaceae bacterium]
MYTKEQFAKMIDHTLLRPNATRDDVMRVVEEAAVRHFASVCLFPCWVGTASRALANTDVKVCSVVSFPFGADSRSAKNFAVRNAIANGAKEIDAVMNISRFKSGDQEGTARDLAEMVDAVRSSGSNGFTGESRRVLMKIIIETCYLSDAEKEVASRMVRDAGADFVKTS